MSDGSVDPATQMMGRSILTGAAALMLFSAYTVMTAHGEVSSMVQVQCVVCMLMGAVGVVLVAGKLQPISLSAILDGATNTFDDFNPDFMVFNHRGAIHAKSK